MDKVLVVDDKATNRQILQEMLTSIGLDVVQATDGLEAVEMFQQNLPSLVLMDIEMPNMDGIEATRLIKQAAGDTFVPVIMISGVGDNEVIRRSIETGGDDFIHRPFSCEVLQAKITAIQRIRDLYQNVQRLESIRRHEHNVAEEIFSNAVDKGNVTFDQIKIHKRAASTFSGDVQITARRPNGDINILLGDFTGHGLTSVVGALPLAETFRAMTSKGYEAEQILTQINRKLHSILPTGLFLAADMVTLSPNGQCKIWNGGMPDIFVLSSDGEVRLRIESGDPPLGIVPQLPDLNIRLIQVEPDEKILLMSDGVLEARSNDDEYFGEQRLLWAVKLGSREGNIIGRIMRSVDSFLRDYEQDDDISLIEIPGKISFPLEQEAVLPLVSQVDTSEEESAGWTWSIRLQGGNLKVVNPVAIAISQLQEVEGPSEQWQDVFTILTELFVNALDHGVLKLPSSLKSSAEGFSEYFAQREEGLLHLDNDHYVSIAMSIVKLQQESMLKITVNDSGVGFDHAHWLEKISGPNYENPGLSGRGIMLVKELCQSLEYSYDGTKVSAEYAWRG